MYICQRGQRDVATLLKQGGVTSLLHLPIDFFAALSNVAFFMSKPNITHDLLTGGWESCGVRVLYVTRHELRCCLRVREGIDVADCAAEPGQAGCQVSTVETLYNTINFSWSTHKRHSIARPKGRGMGCLLWVQRATYSVDLSILSSIKYLL